MLTAVYRRPRFGLRRLRGFILSPDWSAAVTDPTSNDNEPDSMKPCPPADAAGQAAILLVESLMHGLVARSILTVADAVEIVETAAEVKEDIATDRGESSDSTRASLTILEAISASLRIDHPGEPG